MADHDENNDPSTKSMGDASGPFGWSRRCDPTMPHQDDETLPDADEQKKGDVELEKRYTMILAQPEIGEFTRYQVQKRLGLGSQAIVMLCGRRSADGFDHPLALKIFSPGLYGRDARYLVDMARMGSVMNRIANIQHDNLVGIRLWTSCDEIRMLEMEWIDGLDLRVLMQLKTFGRLEACPDVGEREHLMKVVVRRGAKQSYLTPGIAMAIIRDCLAGLASLHDANIVHNDVKPSNIMVKKTGKVKLIDVGAAEGLGDPPPVHHLCTACYAAPEYLEKHQAIPQSDVASLGYVLVELLTGRPPFSVKCDERKLIELKREFVGTLDSILPEDVRESRILMDFLRRMVTHDLNERFQNAGEADLALRCGAAEFQRELVRSNLATEYTQELRRWLAVIR